MILASASSSTAGALGFLVVLLLLVATWLLIRNMNQRLRRLPKSFDRKDTPDRDAEK